MISILIKFDSFENVAISNIKFHYIFHFWSVIITDRNLFIWNIGRDELLFDYAFLSSLMNTSFLKQKVEQIFKCNFWISSKIRKNARVNYFCLIIYQEWLTWFNVSTLFQVGLSDWINNNIIIFSKNSNNFDIFWKIMVSKKCYV